MIGALVGSTSRWFTNAAIRARVRPPVADGAQVGLEWISEKHQETRHLRARHIGVLEARRTARAGARPPRTVGP